MVSFARFRRVLPDEAGFSDWTAGDGWRLRRFDWPAQGATPRGAILFEGGRGDVIEKYLELAAHWHAEGWSVTSLDWRGQGGSGRLSPNRHVGHVDRFETYINDFELFYAEWAASVIGPRVLIGHSMGGHLALRALIEGLARPDAAVLVAPMLGLHSPLGARGGEWLARAMARIGNPARAAWKANEIPGATATRQVLLTHDKDRYQDELWWQQANPDLLLGPPSWQWVYRAFVSTRHVRDNPALASMAVPILMLIADADKLVDPKAALAIANRLSAVEVVRFGGESAHEILREADPVRDRAIAAIDRFLEAHAPRP